MCRWRPATGCNLLLRCGYYGCRYVCRIVGAEDPDSEQLMILVAPTAASPVLVKAGVRVSGMLFCAHALLLLLLLLLL